VNECKPLKPGLDCRQFCLRSLFELVIGVVRRCRLIVSKPVLKAPMVSTLEATI
jgi:hypothetical protein